MNVAILHEEEPQPTLIVGDLMLADALAAVTLDAHSLTVDRQGLGGAGACSPMATARAWSTVAKVAAVERPAVGAANVLGVSSGRSEHTVTLALDGVSLSPISAVPRIR